MDEHRTLNDGLGEGVSYRGRLLVALKTDILDSSESGPAQVEVDVTQPISEVCRGKCMDPNNFMLKAIM